MRVRQACTYAHPQLSDIHTVELGVVIGSRARDVQASDAMQHVAGYTLAIDMCARQGQCKRCFADI